MAQSTNGPVEQSHTGVPGLKIRGAAHKEVGPSPRAVARAMPRRALPFAEAVKKPYGLPGTLEGGLVGWRLLSEPPPVAVAGAGLAGCLAAVYLARRGEKVSVFEYRDDPRKQKKNIGRSINLTLTSRGLTALGKVGLREDIEALGVRLNGRVVHSPGAPPVFVPYGPDPEKHYLLSVPRPDLNKRLIDAAEAEPNVTLRFNHKLLNVELPAHPAVPNVSDPDTYTRMVFQRTSGATVREMGTKNLRVGAKTTTASVKAVIGADGMFSRVRSSLQRKTPRFDFSQNFIAAGYKELLIPADPLGTGPFGRWRLDKNALHLWPRGKFMMIAQPNHDGSFSCTLFMPFSAEHSPEGSFDVLQTKEQVMKFFQRHFNDAIPLLPQLLEDWFRNPTSPLCTVRCNPFNYGGAAVLIGDAAHAIVPFYGQGCNSAFEDCTLIAELWDEHNGDTAQVFAHFSSVRKQHVDAIADLAVEHYHELANKDVQPTLSFGRIKQRLDATVAANWLFRMVRHAYLYTVAYTVRLLLAATTQ